MVIKIVYPSLLYLALLSNTSIVAQSNQINHAIDFIKLGDYDSAIVALEKALFLGDIKPEKIYQETIFRSLFIDADIRVKTHNLLREYPQKESLNILDSLETGDILEINGLVTDAKDKAIPETVFYFFAVDANGLYAPEYIKAGYGSNNPRLFGYVKTNEKGEFTINTINPPSYIGLNNIRHVHYKVTTPGGVSNEGEFIFSKRPTPSQSQYEWANRVGFQIIDQNKVGNIFKAFIKIKINE